MRMSELDRLTAIVAALDDKYPYDIGEMRPADIAAAILDAFDADHPDCGDRCACYQRGVNDEWEATRD